jgi:hypothetical protein
MNLYVGVTLLLRNALGPADVFLHKPSKVMNRISVKTRKKREVLDTTKTVEALVQKSEPRERESVTYTSSIPRQR